MHDAQTERSAKVQAEQQSGEWSELERVRARAIWGYE